MTDEYCVVKRADLAALMSENKSVDIVAARQRLAAALAHGVNEPWRVNHSYCAFSKGRNNFCESFNTSAEDALQAHGKPGKVLPIYCQFPDALFCGVLVDSRDDEGGEVQYAFGYTDREALAEADRLKAADREG